MRRMELYVNRTGRVITAHTIASALETSPHGRAIKGLMPIVAHASLISGPQLAQTTKELSVLGWSPACILTPKLIDWLRGLPTQLAFLAVRGPAYIMQQPLALKPVSSACACRNSA